MSVPVVPGRGIADTASVNGVPLEGEIDVVLRYKGQSVQGIRV
jgi:hypothetical protein